MKSKINVYLCIMGLFAIVTFSNCASSQHHDFTLKNTLSIFLLHDERNYFFCIPVQYVGDYQIERFEFNNGNIQIGDYDILLKRDEINIYVYLNENADEFGESDGDFYLVYSEENGRISVSKMDEPLAIKYEADGKMNHYYIFIEKYLTDNEMKNIAREYESEKVYSKLAIWYDLIVDNEIQNGNGMLDDFELFDGPLTDPDWFPPNLDFFRAKYL